jgi:hypothetical protein
VWQTSNANHPNLDFGTKTVAINGAITPGGPAIGAQNQQKINEVKAGLNWRFAPNLG